MSKLEFDQESSMSIDFCNNNPQTLLYINDDVAKLLHKQLDTAYVVDLSFEETLKLLVIALRRPTPLQETPFNFRDIQTLVCALKSQNFIAGPESLYDFHYPWIIMTAQFAFSRSMKVEHDNACLNSQPHCRFMFHEEIQGSPVRVARSALLVGSAAHLVPRIKENMAFRTVDHHVEYVIDKIISGAWESATYELANALTYPLGYREYFIDSIMHLVTVFRVVHRGTCVNCFGRDWSVVLGLPLYVACVNASPARRHQQ